MEIESTVKTWREGDQYVVQATPVDVMTSGMSPEDARKASKEALHFSL
jgi:hypothetical protein